MNEKIRAWMEQRATALTQARTILDGAYAENRDLNTDEQGKYDGFNAEYDSLTAKINREQALADREAGSARSANGGRTRTAASSQAATATSARRSHRGAEYRRSLLHGTWRMACRMPACAPKPAAAPRCGHPRSVAGGEGATGACSHGRDGARDLDEIKKQNVIRQLADVRSSGSDVEIPTRLPTQNRIWSPRALRSPVRRRLR
jgi:HK97 family phage major capsid protein